MPYERKYKYMRNKQHKPRSTTWLERLKNRTNINIQHQSQSNERDVDELEVDESEGHEHENEKNTGIMTETDAIDLVFPENASNITCEENDYDWMSTDDKKIKHTGTII